MAKTEKPPRVSLSQAARAFERVLADADPIRASGLEGLRQLRRAKDTGLERQQARLSATLGAKHPRVLALAAQRAANAAAVRQLDFEIGRAGIPALKPDPKAWILHGRVLHPDGTGAAGMTVVLYDRRGARIERVKPGSTDQSGYFCISVGGEQRVGVEPKHEHAEVRKDGPMASVCVLDSAGAIVHRHPRMLVPEVGGVDYVEMVLDRSVPSSEAGCTEPGKGR